MTEQLQLTVSGTIAESVLALIKDRFDHVHTRALPGPATVVTIAHIDQAGERAILNLLWDTGHEIGSMSSRPPGTFDYERLLAPDDVAGLRRLSVQGDLEPEGGY